MKRFLYLFDFVLSLVLYNCVFEFIFWIKCFPNKTVIINLRYKNACITLQQYNSIPRKQHLSMLLRGILSKFVDYQNNDEITT